MFSVAIKSGEAFEPGLPELLFDGPYTMAGGGDPHYDVSPTGVDF